MKKTMLFLMLLPLFQANAQQFTVHTLEECLAYAKANNPGLSGEVSRAEASVAQIGVTRSALLPQLSAVGVYEDYFSLPVQLIPAEFLGGTEGEFREVRFGTRHNLSAGLEASMPLFNAPLWQNFKSSKLQAAAQQAWQEAAVLDIGLQTAEAYYYSLLAQKALALSEESLEATQEMMLTANRGLASGILEPMEHNRVKSLLLQAEAQVEDNRAVLAKNLLGLKRLMGLDAGEVLVLAETFEPFDNANSTAFGPAPPADAYPAYRAYSAQAMLAGSRLAAERQKRLPVLTLFANHKVQAQRNQFDFWEAGKPWFNIGLAGLQLEIPLFTGLRHRHSIAKAAAEEKAALSELKAYVQKQESENAVLAIELAREKANLQRYHTAFVLARENHGLMSEKFSEGFVAASQVAESFREQAQAMQQYLSRMAALMSLKAQAAIQVAVSAR